MKKMYTQHDVKEAMGDGGLLDRKGGGEEKRQKYSKLEFKVLLL